MWPYAPLEHKGAGPAIPADLFDGDENVCVDFRYSQDPRLNWWFDHHISAFQAAGRRGPLPGRQQRAEVLRPHRQELRALPGPHGWPNGSASTPAGGGADRVGGDHRRRPVPQPADAGRAEGAGPAADDLGREQPRPGAGRALHPGPGLAAPRRASRRAPTSPSRWGPILEQHRRNIEPVRRVARVEDGVVVSDFLGREGRRR